MMAFEAAQGVEPTWSDHLCLEQNSDLRPGGEKDADEGFLQYFCPFPAPKSLGADYDPVHKEGTIRYVAQMRWISLTLSNRKERSANEIRRKLGSKALNN